MAGERTDAAWFDQAVRAHRLIAILRAPRPTHVAAAAEVLVAHGVRLLEVTLTGEDPLRGLRACGHLQSDDVIIGAGTVVTAEQAQAAADAGARYLVTPACIPEVIEEAQRLGLPVLPGALTPSEILSCVRLGASIVKLFPASLGGPRYLKDVRAPLPDIPLVPTGGIGVEDISAYLAAGAVAVGMGSPLTGDALETGVFDEVETRVAGALARCAAP